MTSDAATICPGCKQPITSESPMGLCPECLVRSGFPTGEKASAAGPPRPKFQAPGVEELRSLFPQLEIESLIGKGGMGAVYKARQPLLNRFVALKILAREDSGDGHFANRFQREAQVLAQLSHPNIVTVYDFGRTGEHFFLLMEYVDGLNLRQLQRTRKLEPEEALSIVPIICGALQYAHERGIVHRDIKPENILLDRTGQIKIADFGIAKLLDHSPAGEPITADQQIIGTPHYMAPEQVELPAIVDRRADIYSLGVVFYEMLTGELPLGRFAPPSTKVHIDARLDQVVLRALEKQPELRYQNASDVKDRVEEITSSTPRKVPKVPWQIWVVIVMLGIEGMGNLFSIPRQPIAAAWLAGKCLMITGLLLYWRPVYVLALLLMAVHVITFATVSALAAGLNLLLLLLTASQWRNYMGEHRRT